MEIVLSVSRTWWRRGVNSHRKGSKRIWQVYYLEGESLQDAKLRTKRISALMVPYYKSKIRRKRMAYCGECQEPHIGFFKNDKEILKYECEVCGEGKLYPDDSLEQFDKVLQDLQS